MADILHPVSGKFVKACRLPGFTEDWAWGPPGYTIVKRTDWAGEKVMACGRTGSLFAGSIPFTCIVLNRWTVGGWNKDLRIRPVEKYRPEDFGFCPPPLTGKITSSLTGNRIKLRVRVSGPNGSREINAMLDTGGVTTSFPDQMLRDLGYTPVASVVVGGMVGGVVTPAYKYVIPYPEVWDNGAWVSLGHGSMTVLGVVNMGTEPLIAPDVLKAGTRLSTDGARWSLQPACP